MVYTTGQFIEFLERAFGSGRLSASGKNFDVVCPVCVETKGRDYSKRKLSVLVEVEGGPFHCWVCQFKARTIVPALWKLKSESLVKEFKEKFGHGLPGNDEEDLPQTRLELPQGFTLLAELQGKAEQHPIVHRAMTYLLKTRGLSPRDLWYFKLGITTKDPDYVNRVIVPSHALDSSLNFITARSVDKHTWPRYYNPPLVDRKQIVFNEINIDWSEEVVVVEGPFDLMKSTDNTVPLLGSDLNPTYRLFQEIVANNTPVALALDNDAKQKTYRLASLFLSYGVSVRMVELPDNVKDVGELSKPAFNQCLSCATIIHDPGDLVSYRLHL